MTRVMLAWEAGAGRGHVVTLARVGRALHGMAECDAALGWMTHAAELEPWCTAVFPGVALPYQRAARTKRRAPPNATWADYLNDCGFADGQRLRANVVWWLQMLARRRISLLIGDYAPCALLAARIAGIPALAVGTGYGIPPQTLPEFPVFLPEYAEREAVEAELVAVANDALGPLGLPRLRALPDIYARSDDLLRTLPLLDAYAEWRDPDAYMPPVTDFGGRSDGTGEEAFCYFSTTELANEGLVEALCSARFPLRAFLPGVAPDIRARLTGSGVRVEDASVPVEEIVRNSRLVLNSGQHGILCLGLAAGIPQVCIPQHLEQLYHARRAETAGVARVIWPRSSPRDMLLDLFHAAWQDQVMSQRARRLALQLAPHFVADDREALRSRLFPWLGGTTSMS
ncbi:MAG TPA: hypothetical protein VNR60_05130 [Croceibacterium sp.]|nr:hypothetical protein [Croceibacterium sp.]